MEYTMDTNTVSRIIEGGLIAFEKCYKTALFLCLDAHIAPSDATVGS